MALTQRQAKVLLKLRSNPVELAKRLGFTLLTDLHNDWITDMVWGKGDKTLQAHRGSYKTTCVSIGLMLIIILYPNQRTAFMRKTDSDVKEVVAQVKKMLETEFVRGIVEELYGVPLILTKASATEISTNLTDDPRGAGQLMGMGLGGSLTGKHFDRIFTDDIVNVQDRISRAEREHTKIVYQELQNIKNRGGRIYNTGTPWHIDDCFSIMPKAEKYDCYNTGLITKEELEEIRASMLPSLFAANYELRHIASEDVIFTDPETGADPAIIDQARQCHIDAAYGGEDYTAFTIVKKTGGRYYVFGRMWHKHVDDVKGEIIALRKAFNAGKIYCETNGDKGYLVKELRAEGERVVPYSEKMNKFLKITTYLKGEWNNVVFVQGTDEDYIRQICDFNENAEHDDAPDSLASLIRLLWSRKDEGERYKPLWN